MKPLQPDEALFAIVRSTPLPRGALTKKPWDYIKKHKLQDEKKRTSINADAALKVVFNGKNRDDVRDDKARLGTRQIGIAAVPAMNVRRCARSGGKVV